MLIVVALGGNALLERGQPMEVENQRRNVKSTAKALGELATKHQVVICHGNGPQVGLLALQNDAYKKVRPYPLDVLGAESQGMIGYMIQQELGNQLPYKSVATLLTQVAVDQNDPAFKDPSKPIGPIYSQKEAEKLAKERHWNVAADGDYFRRVVPSPQPKEIIELPIIRALLSEGTVVICGGGGGIPVIRGKDNHLQGIEAVIDKDNTTSLIAEKLHADMLIILTDVPAVCENFGKSDEKRIKKASPDHLSTMPFARGSMGPKVTATSRFVKNTNKKAAIGKLTEVLDILEGKSGTTITNDVDGVEYY